MKTLISVSTLTQHRSRFSEVTASPVVNRHALEARLSRLEKRLKVPVKERHRCVGRLKKAPELKIIGERVYKHRGVALDKTGKINNKAIVPVSVQIQGEEAVQKHLDRFKVCFT